MELKPELAQSIVDHMMTQIPYNINIMNKEGYIIASGNKDRINTLHVGAVDAINQQKTLPMDRQYGNHGQPGVNMPLEFDQEIIGVVGITGDPSKVIPLASLLKTAVELLLQQKQENEQKQELAKNWQRFIYRWINLSRYQDPQLDKGLVADAQYLKINLNKKRLVIAIRCSPQQLQRLTSSPEIISFALTNRVGLLILNSTYQAKRLQQRLNQQKLDYGVSEWGERLGKLVDQANTTLNLCHILGQPARRQYRQIAFIQQLLASNLPNTQMIEQYQVLLKRQDGEEIIQTIREFINCNMNINQTAHNLFVHRNTLHNRLIRIKRLLGLNPQNTEELFQLFVGYILFYAQEIKQAAE